MVKVDFWTDSYELSHGKLPKGFGSWAFSTNPSEDGDSPNIFWVHRANFGAAKKFAKEHFSKGRQPSEVVRIHVLA